MLRRLTALTLVVVLLSACTATGGGAGPRAWRDLDLVVPDGWLVLDERADLLLVANTDLRASDDELDQGPTFPLDPDVSDVVAVQMTTDAGSSADDWRALIASEGGVMEADERLDVGGLPATSLTFRWTTNGVDTRERVVIVPSRQLVILLQPVPIQGQTNAPDVYLAHVDEFESLLTSIVFGRPEDQ